MNTARGERTRQLISPLAGVGMDIAGPQALPYTIMLFSVLSLCISLSLLAGKRTVSV